MDGSQFDRLARTLGTLRSRRTATALLGGLITAPIIARGNADAKPKKNRKKRCKAPKKKCGGKCIAVQSDDANCGACGNRCSRTEICRAGQCEALVPPVDCPIGQCCEDNQVCGEDGRCRDGECQPKPNCLANGETFRDGEGQCCSENVSCQPETTGIDCTCMPGNPGNACLRNTDCSSGRCVGYQCVACPRATCQSLGKQCGTWSDGCGGSVDCGKCGIGAKSLCADGICKSCSEVYGAICNKAIHTTSGWTTCATWVDAGNCDEPCETDADCRSLNGYCAYSSTAGGVTTPGCPTVAKTCIYAAVCLSNERARD